MRAFLSWWRAPGRDIALFVLAIALIPQAAGVAPLETLRDRGFDIAQRLWPLPPGGTLVQVVTVNDKSLKRYGQWPWPRTLIANLVQRIAAGKPLVLGVDILFAEPDGYSPRRLAHTLPGLPASIAEGLAAMASSDEQLAAAFAKVPTVLGAGPVAIPVAGGADAHAVTLIRQLGGNPRPYVPAYPSVLRTLTEISQTARAEGAITIQPDDDGVVRAVPLLSRVDDELIPGLALQLIRVAVGLNSLDVQVGSGGIASIGLGPLTLPTDAHGRVFLHFGLPRARNVSAATVLEPGFDPRQFEGQIVLLGVTGLGLGDQRYTPLGLSDGIDVHAQLIEGILGSTLLHRPAYTFWLELALIMAAGLTAIALVRYENPPVAAAAVFGIVAGLIVGEFLLFRFASWLIDGIYPAIVVLLVSAGMLVGHLRAAQAARRRLAAELERERELKARTEGELAVARDLQLGLLPHRFPPFPERLDIDLYARIEPARAVGGDFFDYQLIDDNHLFFIIADVSGKGVPAALFMELTLQIVRAAVQRHACDLASIITEANAKTAEASIDLGERGEGMFVTAFIGIFDTVTGDIDYASAGHDSPFVLREPDGLRQLATDGGPPLGVLDYYPYPIDHGRVARDAILVLFTDGVTEAQDAGGRLYSLGRISDTLKETEASDARSTVDACFAAVARFVGDAEQADDITMLAIRVAPI